MYITYQTGKAEGGPRPLTKFSRSESKAEVSGCIFQPDIDMIEHPFGQLVCAPITFSRNDPYDLTTGWKKRVSRFCTI